MDRVETNVAVAADELHLDHHQVVDVLQVVADHVLGMSVVVPLDHQVAGGAHADLVRDMTRKHKLAVAPLDLDLFAMLTTQCWQCSHQPEFAYPLVPDVQIVAAHVVMELFGIGRAEERNRGRALVGPQKDIQEQPATHGARDVGMSYPLCEVRELEGAGALPLKLRPLALRLDVVGAGGSLDG